MHRMRSFKIGLLIISNYTHHLLEKIIIYHIIYIKKIIHIKFKVHCRILFTISNIDTAMAWY